MGINILVVDDSVAIRRMLCNVLTSAGHTVSEGCTGLEGADLAAASRFDLVITDVNMPHMDGLELVKQLRQTADYKFTPMIFLTTETSDEFRSKGKAVGATAWLTKPFSPQNLLDLVRKVV